MAQLAALLKGPTVDQAAHRAATSDLNLLRKPTQAQAEAGNYRKGHVRIGGLDIAIENPAGSYRRPEWPPMQAHYGYAKASSGADGDEVDVFVRPGTPTDWAGTVYVIDQPTAGGGFDEHKAMLGFNAVREAVQCYLAHYPPDWRLGAVTPLPMAAFKAWLRSGDTTAPMAKEFSAPASPTVGLAPYVLEGQDGAGKKRRKKKRVRLKPGASLLQLVKWNPDQPRDELGRWSGDGGGGYPQATGRETAGISTPATNAMAELNAEHLARLGPEQAVKLRQMYAAAADAKPAFDAALTQIAEKAGGEAKLPGLKGSARATEKILADYGGQAGQIKDIVRATVEVRSVADAQAALSGVKERFEVLPSGYRDLLNPQADPVDGYRDIKVNVRLPNGTVGEVQVNVPALLAVKKEQHVTYEARRSIEARISTEQRDATQAEKAQIAALNATMKAAYAPVRRKISGGSASLERLLKWNPDQPREPAGTDEGGQWAGGAGGSGTSAAKTAAAATASQAEKAAALKLAKKKIRNAPVPTPEQVAKARADMLNARRAGGESRGGSAASRRIQRENLFREFGGAERGYVVCPWTGIKMHYTDDRTRNPHGYPKFERGKIFTKMQGGGYQLPNLIPESFAANRTRNDKPIRRENR